MRIAVLNWTVRRVGGTETYLAGIVPALQRRGHETAFWHEVDRPADREVMHFTGDTPVWSAAALGAKQALAALQAWRPDVLYAHGLLDPDLEARTLDIAPAAFFAHAYYGVCISGSKAFSAPTRIPCNRPFGPACLLQFYPRRCGGLNPVTMGVEFVRQRARLRLLTRYRAILTHSEHMQREYERYPGLEHRIHHSWYAAEPLGPPPSRSRKPRAAMTERSALCVCCSWAAWTISKAAISRSMPCRSLRPRCGASCTWSSRETVLRAAGGKPPLTKP